MSQHERYGNRDGERAYSRFHRTSSAERWVGYEDAVRLATVNLDRSLWIECHHKSFEPFALIETAIDIGQTRKAVTATVNLARRTNPIVPAYLVLYTMGDQTDTITDDWEITQLRVKRLYPNPTDFRIVSPKGYFEWLVNLRRRGVDQIAAEARSGSGQKRNHDVPRLLRKIEWVDPQPDFWK